MFEYFVHIVPDETCQQITEKMSSLRHSLSDLGLEVSTGRVVDSRAIDFIREKPLKTRLLWFVKQFSKMGKMACSRQ